MGMQNAAREGLEKIQAYLADNPEDLNAYGIRRKLGIWQWFTFLGYACLKGEVEVVHFLLQQDGIDVNRGERLSGRTPLDLAVKSSCEDVIYLLSQVDGAECFECGEALTNFQIKTEAGRKKSARK